MEIRAVDVHDDVTLRGVYDVDTRASLEGREDSPHWTWQEMSTMFRMPDPGERRVLVGGYEGGHLVGAGFLFLPTMDNTDKGWVHAIVDPAQQGRGHGRALLEHLLATAKDDGRTSICAETKIAFEHVLDHRNRRFAEAAGFTYSNVEIVRYLDLPVPESTIRGWSAEAGEKSAGYRVETFVDVIPDELLESYCLLLGQLAVDAPTGAVDWEEEKITPERHAANRRSLRAAGRTMYDTMAITPEGVVAAHSTMAVPGHGKTDVSQWGTFVHREHRGHRLGLATKAGNLLAVQRAHPLMRRIVTQNGETNQWMIAVNEQMGFEPVEASMEFVRTL